ncbi:hypothetical protein ACLI1A_13505 [Flavobacterium sp. RHBU_3]|uniref:hypothetical protein n=1 Tax=Flavobacterium sp. RHBU_3 TaxID=3391184 RepID=UPI0039853F8F
MKTKKLLAAVMLLGGAMAVNAQGVATSTETGYGVDTGVYLSTTTSTVHIGYQAGKTSLGNNNTIVGHGAGSLATAAGTGSNNCFFGLSSGAKNTSGESNVFIGTNSGYTNTIGNYNICIGTGSGSNSGTVSTSNSNLFIGHGAGSANVSGGGNVYLGFVSGVNCTGGGNVFIGSASGSNVTSVSNKLYIANSGTTSPLIYGDFSGNKVGIGGYAPLSTSDGFPTTAGGATLTNYKLFVQGGILAQEVRVATTWADYVFDNDYKLRPLSEVEQYIAQNGHLPNVPSAEVVEADGIEVGAMAKIQQEKIEELTLYAIAQDKKIEAQQKQLEQQQKEIEELKAAVKAISEKK